MGPGLRRDDLAEAFRFEVRRHCEERSDEAIQSRMRGSGLPRRFAPRNDVGETCVLVLATHSARALHQHHPQKVRGRREGRVAAAPGAPAQRVIARARKPQVQAVITPAFPARWFYGLYALSSVNHPVCHRHRRDARSIVGNLAPDLWGARTTRLRRPRSAPLVNRHLRVHRIPASRVVTSAIRPSEERGGMAQANADFRKCASEIFSRRRS
jgi:hypothetical protein